MDSKIQLSHHFCDCLTPPVAQGKGCAACAVSFPVEALIGGGIEVVVYLNAVNVISREDLSYSVADKGDSIAVSGAEIPSAAAFNNVCALFGAVVIPLADNAVCTQS